MQGHQVLEVHTQHRQPEACTGSPGSAITGIVVVGSEQLSQLQQGLCGRPCWGEGSMLWWGTKFCSLSPSGGVYFSSPLCGLLGPNVIFGHFPKPYPCPTSSLGPQARVILPTPTSDHGYCIILKCFLTPQCPLNKVQTL